MGSWKDRGDPLWRRCVLFNCAFNTHTHCAYRNMRCLSSNSLFPGVSRTGILDRASCDVLLQSTMEEDQVSCMMALQRGGWRVKEVEHRETIQLNADIMESRSLDKLR